MGPKAWAYTAVLSLVIEAAQVEDRFFSMQRPAQRQHFARMRPPWDISLFAISKCPKTSKCHEACTILLSPQDASSTRKRQVGVRTLGQIVASTGAVMSPYLDFPQLLAVLLRMLHEGNAQQRKDVMKARLTVLLIES